MTRDAAPDRSNRPLPERIAELDAERQAIELRKTAHTLREIADIQGCSVSTAHRRVNRGFRRLAPSRKLRPSAPVRTTCSTPASASSSSSSLRTPPAPPF